MFGVFISLDLMLYYGFWELSLVPMAILIAMYGRKEGPRAALKFFLFTFIPSAPLLVAILWLYARTGHLQLHRSPISNRQRRPSRRRALLGRARVPLRLRRQSSRLSAPRLARRHLQRSARRARHGRRRQARPLLHAPLPRGLFPAQARAIAPLLIALAVIGILYGACLALVQRDFWRLIAFAALSHLSLIVLAIYGLTFTGLVRRRLPDSFPRRRRRALVPPPRRARASLRHKPHRLLRRACRQTSPRGHVSLSSPRSP